MRHLRVRCPRLLLSTSSTGTGSGITTAHNPDLTSKCHSRIIQSFNQGNYEAAIISFTRLAPQNRTTSLYHAAISACAQVPDATAAVALLNAMSSPTPSALHSTVSALCRQRDPEAATHVLETAVRGGRSDLVNSNLIFHVIRVAHRCKRPDIVSKLNQLSINGSSSFQTDKTGEKHSTHHSATALSGCKQKQNTSTSSSLQFVNSKQNAQLTDNTIHAERRLRAHIPNIEKVHQSWLSISSDPQLRSEPGVLSAAISALAQCRSSSSNRSSFNASLNRHASLSLNTLMTWVRHELYDPATNLAHPHFTSDRSSMALILTAATTALSGSSSSDPLLVLSAYDALSALQLPGFHTSLPLSGAYLQALHHAQLSLDVTKERIFSVWRHHVQFDERAFCMALGAILKSKATAADRLRDARHWLNIMKEAGVPLTVYAYNLLARELKHSGGDVRLGVQLLKEMRDAGVQPTAVTYGYVFNAYISGREYTSWERKKHRENNGEIVELCKTVLDGIKEHMDESGIHHSTFSALALAKAYAHLGELDAALNEFGTYIHLSPLPSVDARDRQVGFQEEGTIGNETGYSPINSAKKENQISEQTRDMKLKHGFNELLHTIAHGRVCGQVSTEMVTHLIDQMHSEFKLKPTGAALDALIVSLVRTERISEVVKHVGEWEHGRGGMSVSGVKLLLQALCLESNDYAWTHGGIAEIAHMNKSLLTRQEAQATVRSLVMHFARLGSRNICEELMEVSGLRVGLDGIFTGREFSAMRAGRRESGVSKQYPTSEKKPLDELSPIGRSIEQTSTMGSDTDVLPST